MQAKDRERLYGVIAARHGPAIGRAADISYTVNVSIGGGTQTTGPVVPSHRRPSSTLDIEAAQVGDICDVIIAAGRMYFVIYEGLASQEACP